jgi:ABC-type lipoprotein release transport system permease subunit
MKVADILALSFKNIKIDKLRNILVSSTIGIGVFLILIFSVMKNTVVEIEKMKSENNPEYRKITILPLLNTGNSQIVGIDLYSLNDLEKIKHVEAVNLVNEYHLEENEIINHHSDEYFLNERIGEYIWIDGIKIKDPEKKLFTAFDRFSLFDQTKVELAQKIDTNFSVYLCGRQLSNGNNALEVILDDVTAYRFSRCSNLIISRKEAINRMLNKSIEFVVNGEVINATIVGIYDYRSYMSQAISDTLEDKELMDSFINFTYSDAELNGSKELTQADICFPIFMNENLRRVIEKTYSGSLNGQELENFTNYQGRIEIIVDNISSIKEVTEKIKNDYSYFITSNEEQAQTAIDRMFFFKKIILLMGGIISTIALLTIINTMFMIVNERQHYMGVILVVGYNRASLIRIISAEAAWFGLFGNLVGVSLTFISKEIISSVLRNRLHESGLYRYISVELNTGYVVAVFTVSMLVIYIAGLLPTIYVSEKKTLDLLNN